MNNFINNLAYEASAGSGKTFMLVVRYLSLLFMGFNPSKILALTFTNKAANEMQERIIKTLSHLQDSAELDEISKNISVSKDEILKRRDKILDSFLNADIKIMTIDSFFVQILRKFSLYVSLMPDFDTLSSQHDIKLQDNFLKYTTLDNKKNMLISFWIQTQKRFDDVFMLFEEIYIKNNEIKNFNFSKQDFWIFEQKAITLTKELGNIIQNHPQASKTAKQSFDIADFKELCEKKWIQRESLDYRVFAKCYEPFMDDMLKKIKAEMKKAFLAKESSFFYYLNNLFGIYKKAKKYIYENDKELSFNDVTVLVYEILKNINDSDFLYFRLDSNIEHILLDEFQDTSVIQYEILKPLIDEITSKGDGSFFFVGDVKQSIYRFRGGNSALFAEVAKEQNTQLKKLKTNYRSKKEIVEFVNTIFQKKINNYTPQQSSNQIQGGYVEVCIDENIIDGVVLKVKHLIDNGANPNDIAVLCATNADGDVFKEAISENGIEVVTETTTKLINQPLIRAIIEYLKFLYFKEDIYRYNFFSLLGRDTGKMIYFDISSNTLDELVVLIAKKYNLFDGEMHLFRFLDAIAYYDDIESFLFEYERLDAQVASSDINGVRVLTIHKSKGLEYLHVIVADRLKQPPPFKNTIIWDYEGIKLKNIFLNLKSREFVDEDYKNALEKDKKLVKEDALNALYVAFTRAKENLFIVAKQKASMFEMLELKQGSFGVFDTGKNDLKQNIFSDKIDFEDLYYGVQSNVLRQLSDDEGDLKSINFGIAMHYMLEMLGGFSLESINNAQNAMLNKFGNILTSTETQDIFNRIKMLLENKTFLDISKGICYKEKALKYADSLKYIDLLVETPDGYNIIDYKSSIKYQNKHFLQIKEYIEAVSSITNKQTNGYVCYLLEDEIKILKVN